ncbi:YceI family protein [Bergeyella sp. RCAD1439]|uniref:YceI family protein n=1 Tax=Bergeyella anatis TaxID=3113737 RepID=UPI002E173B8C|nr:YceI family protein [Bergeyella sp. RCAD1439]
MKKLMAFLAVVWFSVSLSAQKNLVSDAVHSRIQFSVIHLTVNDIIGGFDEAKLSIYGNETDFLKSQINFEAEVGSVNTHVEARDKHLKSADFFDAATYPKMVFSSTSIKRLKKNYYEVKGNLLLHGVTKPVTVTLVYRGSTVNPMSKKTTYGYEVLGTIKRSDFGIGAKFPEAVISDQVRIKGNFELIES